LLLIGYAVDFVESSSGHIDNRVTIATSSAW
jgi:hypothetical protein